MAGEQLSDGSYVKGNATLLVVTLALRIEIIHLWARGIAPLYLVVVKLDKMMGVQYILLTNANDSLSSSLLFG